ncbi:heavy metal transport/detoxification protein [Rudanella paleaurantiibacter]|uniref:Heavy metal transport/detoxification protein n=1 Tax=Rudanella paleaurantiibacter TaxID=2614655 RepID=A0A7J5TSR8_9BACT|nr:MULTISPECIES: heavy-metal-associated domain-containing protein [Rudanella]KAB7726466.1 heavy metal transport/detoxification protein [Rudanella paleaurantiibacter]
METIKLKTNIKCGGCVATVTPFLNQTVGDGNWQVDTQNPDKVLTVTTEEATPETVQQAVQQAGFKAEPLS